MEYRIGDSAYFEKTISESDVYLYAGITGDLNDLHINKVEAQKSIFGQRIVHGMLASGLISTAIGMYLPGKGTIYMEQSVKFCSPVLFGDTLRATVTIAEILNEQKRILRLDTIVTNQQQEVVIKGEAVVKAPQKER